MKIAYLILAHNTPRHLGRLVVALSSASSRIAIHVDAKSDLSEFCGIHGGSVHFAEERVRVFWGDFSQVEATLALLRMTLADANRFDRFVLLSGSDYPLRSAAYLERFFARNTDKEFMNLVEMPSDAAGKPLARLTTYRTRPGDPAASRVLRRFLMKLGVSPSRRDYSIYLRELVPCGGSSWWALTREACEHIISFVDEEAAVVKFFKNTICPDESFFHTILGNSRFRPRIVRNLTYADWSAGGSSPAVIEDRHIAFLNSTPSFLHDDVYGEGEMLFARKFPDDSEALLARLTSSVLPE